MLGERYTIMRDLIPGVTDPLDRFPPLIVEVVARDGKEIGSDLRRRIGIVTERCRNWRGRESQVTQELKFNCKLCRTPL